MALATATPMLVGSHSADGDPAARTTRLASTWWLLETENICQRPGRLGGGLRLPPATGRHALATEPEPLHFRFKNWPPLLLAMPDRSGVC
jgi:hypothetical protein